MKKIVWIIAVVALGLFSRVSEVHACGHEGPYVGLGYTQLFLFSHEGQLVAGGSNPAQPISFDSRVGGQAKFGYDFCASRFGIEVPFGFAVQQLNRSETVHVYSLDTNAIIHIVETEQGADFYWIAGIGINIISEGTVNNNTGGAGMNVNFGPGFQYFFARGKHRSAFSISIPFKYTLYVGDNLSANTTSVYAVPIQLGFTFGF